MWRYEFLKFIFEISDIRVYMFSYVSETNIGSLKHLMKTSDQADILQRISVYDTLYIRKILKRLPQISYLWIVLYISSYNKPLVLQYHFFQKVLDYITPTITKIQTKHFDHISNNFFASLLSLLAITISISIIQANLDC